MVFYYMCCKHSTFDSLKLKSRSDTNSKRVLTNLSGSRAGKTARKVPYARSRIHNGARQKSMFSGFSAGFVETEKNEGVLLNRAGG